MIQAIALSLACIALLYWLIEKRNQGVTRFLERCWNLSKETHMMRQEQKIKRWLKSYWLELLLTSAIVTLTIYFVCV